MKCNYSFDQINITSPFYYELLSSHNYVIWNNKKILIDDKSVFFYRNYHVKGIKFVDDLLLSKKDL